MNPVMLRLSVSLSVRLLVALGWWGLSVWAVAAQIRFDHWTTAQGLPHNSITCITQTRDGYLWLGTTDGLARFDGVRFTVFNTVTSPGFVSNRIRALYEDRRGVLWIGTEDGGVMRYVERRFEAQNEGLSDNGIWRIDEDDEGAIWVYTQTEIARHQGGRFTILTDAPDSPWRAFYPAKSKRDSVIMAGPWFVDENGLHRLAHGRVTTIRFPEPPRLLNILECWEDHLGTVWINTGTRGTYRFRDGQLTLVGAFTNPHTSGATLEDRSGRIWASRQPGWIARWIEGRLIAYPLPLPANAQTNLGLFQDREGTLWVTCLYNGLFRVRPQVITSVAQERTPSYAMWQDQQQNVWLTHYLRYRDGEFTRYDEVQSRSNKIAGGMWEERSGDLLFGTSGGLVRFTQGRFVWEPSPPGQVMALHRDGTGVLWAGGDQGLHRLEPGPMTTFTRKDGLATEDIKAIIPRRGGGLWIGGYGGLTEYRDGRFTITPLSGMPSNRIRTLYEDGDGVLWIGTYDGGLGRWHNGQLTSYTTKQGLYNDGVFQILEDRFGYFWMSCNRGIYRVRKAELNEFAAGRTQSLHCTNFNQADGMRHEECNGGRQPAGFIAADGKLWFPTQEGAAVVDPAAVPSNPQPPPVVIEACRLDNQEVALTEAQRTGLRVEPNQSNLEIQYTGLSLIKSEQISFRYRLLGLDANWTDVGARRTAYFAHLPPGDYTFQVIAANSDGVWNNEGASLKVMVIAPFYRRWWFLGLVALTFVGLGTATYQYRVRGLEKARAAQEEFSRRLIESQEHERKRIAAELHDGLSQSLVIIKNRAALSLDMPEDTANALEQMEEIADASTQALEEVRAVIHDLRPIQLDRLGLTKSLQAMLQRVGEANQLPIHSDLDVVDNILSKEAEINLYRIVQEGLNNIVKHAHATEARVRLKKQAGFVELTITDNGRGFVNAEFGMRTVEAKTNPQSAIHNPQSSGFGLTSIIERARILGCRPQIQSVPGQGTTITLKIPTDEATTV